MTIARKPGRSRPRKALATMSNRTLLVSLCLVLGAGCAKKSARAPEPAPKPVELGSLGLTINVPGGGKTDDSPLGAQGQKGMSVSSDEYGSVNVTVLPAKLTIAQAKAALEKKTAIESGRKDVKPEKVSVEKLGDGFAISYQVPLYSAGGGKKTGDSYGVEVYRTISGKSYRCYSSGIYQRLQATYLAACKSLRK